MGSRRILVTLESRATYGYSANVMKAMQKHGEIEIVTLVTGMHLMSELGGSESQIREDGFPVSVVVPLQPDGEDNGAWARAMGQGMTGFADAMQSLNPDIVMLSGDRAETLTLCITAAYMGIPIAHVQAGDKSGHIDDAARYAIAKLAHIHLASCEDSAERLRRLGEQEFRIFEVGAPQLDDMNRDFTAESISHEGSEYRIDKPYVILMQHPVMAERDEIQDQVRASISACIDSGLQVFWIYPNSDLGYREIMSVIEDYQSNDKVTLISNLKRETYLTLLFNAKALVGNSSSGILEAPSFRLPVINIGNRQRGRPQASNILNCRPTRGAVSETLQKALTDQEFMERCKAAVNPYGDGCSGPRICDVLTSIPLDRRLMDKVTTF